MCIVSFKTITAAQRAKSVLSSHGILSSVVGVDPKLTRRGCSWGLSFECYHKESALRLFNNNGIVFGEVIGK